jgi:hypothetical protein
MAVWLEPADSVVSFFSFEGVYMQPLQNIT